MDIRKYKLISFDMFQTLVDVNSQKESTLKQLFLDDYDQETGNAFWSDADDYVYRYFHRLSTHNESFMYIEDIFEQCYIELFQKYNVKMEPRKGARILVNAHNSAEPYPETIDVIRIVREKYKTCIISDADNSMILGLADKIGISEVYTSENYKRFKFDDTGFLFRRVIEDFGITPAEMLHVGDGTNDVLGASIVGIDTVWVNRTKRKWANVIKPTYEVSSLSELIT